MDPAQAANSNGIETREREFRSYAPGYYMPPLRSYDASAFSRLIKPSCKPTHLAHRLKSCFPTIILNVNSIT